MDNMYRAPRLASLLNWGCILAPSLQDVQGEDKRQCLCAHWKKMPVVPWDPKGLASGTVSGQRYIFGDFGEGF